MSPCRRGSNRFSTGLPMISPSSAATRFTDTGDPPAMLNTRPLAPAASAAALVAATTFATYVKSRDCSPSPWIVIGSPARDRRMKSGTTAAYCESGLWRGPNTLK